MLHDTKEKYKPFSRFIGRLNILFTLFFVVQNENKVLMSETQHLHTHPSVSGKEELVREGSVYLKKIN